MVCVKVAVVTIVLRAMTGSAPVHIKVHSAAFFLTVPDVPETMIDGANELAAFCTGFAKPVSAEISGQLTLAFLWKTVIRLTYVTASTTATNPARVTA